MSDRMRRMTLARFKRDTDQQFAMVWGRFDLVEGRLEAVERRLDRVEVRLDRVEERLDRIERRLEAGFEDVKRHFTVMTESLHGDLALFADAIKTHTEQIADHDGRIRRLESH
jgi:chromosome segregation ATPase